MGKKINILHMYPDLLNLYGDKGNIAALEKRLKWRTIDVEVFTCTSEDDSISFENIDIVFLGGGSDREENTVLKHLLANKDKLREFVESDGTLIATCGGYQMLGKYCKSENGETEGLGILDIYTEVNEPRITGNVVLKTELFEQNIVGFENHAGKVNIGDHTPLGEVVCGGGNSGDSGYEGVLYKNVVATYLHGPLLPKNPMLCDYILGKAMKKKYPYFSGFESINDELENMANRYITDRFATKK